ncbi:Aste57867_24020 [Aphanomyces stellatus]|uniref:Aste57867_24020 protein n=1 Tax=Aphanomyces stellatus TaxID=120398 RepID=A0A485LPJ4_9STRA|nr:hypothetical protein As57867_023947 [Aphanomyces stellatus]VFU00663.1 Aste57867_24020 [Aphanomyces stellatus]
MRVVPAVTVSGPPTTSKPSLRHHHHHHHHHRIYVDMTLLMHFIAFVYLAINVVAISAANGPDLAAVRANYPTLTKLTYASLALLHLGTIAFILCGSRCRWQRTRNDHRSSHPNATGNNHRLHSRNLASYSSASFARVAKHMQDYADEFYVVFNVVEIACQSHQAFAIFSTLPDARMAISYMAIVICYCFASPFVLYIRNAQTKTTLINLSDSIFSFTLSCGHPMVGFARSTLQYLLVNPNLAHDHTWATKNALMIRLLSVANPFDYVCKLAMHIGTYIAFHRLMQSLATHPQPTIQTCPTVEPNYKETPSSPQPMAHALLGLRPHCPPRSIHDIRPLLDYTCQCAYLEVNCATLHTSDPVSFLNVTEVGTHLFTLQISRCSIPQGLPSSALAPFTGLNKICILFSAMEAWDGPLPPSVTNIMVRFSNLQSIPHALQVNLPPKLVVLVLEGCIFDTIPPSIVSTWASIQKLHLMNVSLSAIPPTLASTLQLFDVDFRLNNLSGLPRDWISDAASLGNLKQVVLSGNPLRDSVVPWLLALRGVALDLTSTLVTTLPPTLPIKAMSKRMVVVDDTPSCMANQTSRPDCKVVCAPGCFHFMRGDFFCDLACFTRACDYDGGDCDTMELT